MPDYRKYRFTRREWMKELLRISFEVVFLSFLFFRSLWGCVILLPYGIWRMEESRKIKARERQHLLRMDFKEVILSIAFSLQAGYALNQTIEIAKDDLKRVYGEKPREMAQELDWMGRCIALGQPVEQLFKELAIRSGIGEIRSYGEILSVAKKQGGNLVHISKEAADHISRSVQVQDEIAQVLAGKKMEKEIMLMMPCFILLYLQVTNGDYLAPLFVEWTGRILMTISLILVFVARVWSERIIQIKV